MDARQENRYSAVLKVQAFLSDRAAELAAVTQIATEKLVLDSYIQGIIVNDGIATADTTGYAQAKANARVALTSAALRLTRAAKALAVDTSDPILLKKTDYTKSELDKKRDTELHVSCQQISDFVTPLVPSLSGYLITPAHLTVLNTNLATYYSTLPQPGGQTDIKVVAGRNVEELLNKAYSMLKDKMDTYLDLFLEDDPDLVEQYYLARAIDDNTGGGNGKQTFSGTVGAMSSATAGPVTYKADATVKLVTTSPQGLYFQLMNGGMSSGSQVYVAGLGSEEMKFSMLGVAGDSFMVSNNNGMPGDFSITID
jgi:hypothetical protein